MKTLIKISLISFIFILISSAVLAEPASVWHPGGGIADFEDDISDSVSTTGSNIPATVDDIFEVGSKALRFKHENGKTASYTLTFDNPLTFDPRKVYVLSFDFKTNTIDGYRWIKYGSNGNNTNLIRIKVSNDKNLYLEDTDYSDEDARIAQLTLNEPHNIKLVIDGHRRLLGEIWVDGKQYDFIESRFNKELRYPIDSITIYQQSWKDNVYSWYDNFTFTAVDKTKTDVFYKIAQYDDASVFTDNSAISVCTSVESASAKNSNMYLAVYEGDTLFEVKTYDLALKKGMNYHEGSINIDSNRKVLKVFMWDEGLAPVMVSDVLKGDLTLAEYKSRVKTSLHSEEMPSNADIAAILDTMTAAGSFNNLNYGPKTTDYCYDHCNRLHKLALALANPDYSYGQINKADVASALTRGINYWIDVDAAFTFDNWYYEYITVPEYMGKLLLLAEDAGILDEATMSALADFMASRAQEIDTVSINDSGSNAFQEHRNRSYYALYVNDANMLIDCFEKMGNEMRLASEMTGAGDKWRRKNWSGSVTVTSLPDTIEGIQSDYSALFHGPQLYSGTYGLTFISGISRFLKDTNGLGLFPEDKIENIIDQVLEHYAYIGRGTTLDYSTVGRMIGTDSASAKSGRFDEVYQAAENLLSLGLDYRKQELRSFVDSRYREPAITGHKYFYMADYTAHTKPGYLFTLKASSNRTIASESLICANLKGRSLGDGATFIYQTGREYDDVFVAWDWNRVPGTTAVQKDFDSISSGTHSYQSSASGKVGGAGDNNNGVTAMELIRDDLSAKKAWFMFDGAVVALGADITTEGESPVYTSVNQCISAGDASYADSRGDGYPIPFGTGATTLQTPAWVLHEGIGYIFNSKSDIYVENCVKSGDRYDIDWKGESYKKHSDIQDRNMFSLWFDHTAEGLTAYEYIIVPGADADMLNSLISADSYKVISNTGTLQAVQSGDEMQAAFWQGATADFDNISITADQSCVIAAKPEGGRVKLYAARLDPEITEVNITVTVDGIEQKREKISLPLDGSAVLR